LNTVINTEAISPKFTNDFRKFLVDHGVDYVLVPNAFGWHEMMLVLFNTENIVSSRVVSGKEKIEDYDLPTEFE
jgi:hypothetical protein